MPSISVVVSDFLRETLEPEYIEYLCAEFKWWKSHESREYASILFGKDSASISPTINDVEYSLRHVHLIPLNDKEKLDRWVIKHKLRARKQSDRVLFYVQQAERYYLVAVVNDPGAHEVMRMKKPEHKKYMRNVALEAEKMLAATPA